MRERGRPLNCKNASNTTILRPTGPKSKVLDLKPSSVAQKKSNFLVDEATISKKSRSQSAKLDHKTPLPSPDPTNARSNVHPFTPYATALDEDGFRYLLIAIPGGAPEIVAVDDIASGIRQLMKRGAPLASSSSVAAFRLACDKMIGCPPIARILTMPGFSRSLEEFVHGETVIGSHENFLLLDNRLPASFGLCRSAGTLDGWQGIVEGAKRNRLFSFLLCLAFVGPLNAICGTVNATFLLSGRAATGKTAVSALASSVWGWGRDAAGSRLGCGLSFNSTGNALIPHIACFRDQLAFIDELSFQSGGSDQALAAFVGELIFRLEAGADKARHTDTKPPLLTQAAILLTANDSSRELLASASRPCSQQHFDRLLDLKVPPEGVFTSFHGRPDATTFIRDLKSIAAAHHGVAGPAFVRWILDGRPDEIQKEISQYERLFREHLSRRVSNEQMRAFERPVSSFARVFAAGALARKAKVLPLEFSALGNAAVEFCCSYIADHQRVPTAERHQFLTPLEMLTQFINLESQQLPSLNLRSVTAQDVLAAGAFWSDQGDLFLTKARLVGLIGQGALANGLRRDLAAQGVIGTTGRGKSKRATTVQLYVGARREKVELIQILASQLAFFKAR